MKIQGFKDFFKAVRTLTDLSIFSLENINVKVFTFAMICFA